MAELNVLYQSDNNYAVFMGVSICSLLENNKKAEQITVYVIDDAISEINKQLLVDMVHSYSREVIFLSGEQVLTNKEITDVFAYTGMRKNTHSYLKMFLGELLPDFNGRMIYIDCDTAVTGDIQELITMDMGGKPIGMVKDSLITKSKTSIGFAENDNYYNSGIIVFDMVEWRKHNCSQRILNHIKNVRIYGTVDQDVLNVELKKEIHTVPIEYNLQPIHLDYSFSMYSKVYRHKEEYYSSDEVEKAVSSPKIIHYLRYVGESPWNLGNVHPASGIFDKYLKLTPWCKYQKQARKAGGVFKIEKWLYKHIPKSLFLRVFYVVHEYMIVKSNRIKK